jgi:hypothetical protein
MLLPIGAACRSGVPAADDQPMNAAHRRMSDMEGLVLLALFLTILAIQFGVVPFLRRMRLRAAASALDAEFVDKGWFRAGAIVAKDFEIRIVRAGKAQRTRVHVKAPGTPGHFRLAAEFFRGPPDWQHAKSLQTVSRRVFFTEWSMQTYAPPSEAERRSLKQWLERGSASAATRLEALNAARIRDVELGDDEIAASSGGVVTSVARLQEALAALRLLLPRATAQGRASLPRVLVPPQ